MTEKDEAPRSRATFESLTADDATEFAGQEVVLANGTTVLVRGFTRYEIQLAGKNSNGDPWVVESRNLARCMLEPRLTEAQALAWIKRDPAGGDVSTVSRVIRDLSGLGEGADKSDV